MEQFNVTGMSCAACQARVEKAVLNVEGVENCAVSLLTNSMGVEGTADPNEIIKAVEAAGYGASPKSAQKSKATTNNYEEMLVDRETPILRRRLVSSLIILIPLMYVSMGHMLWNWPLPAFLNGNHVAMGLYELILTTIIMIINQKFFISGFKGLIHRSPNMDTLVALGATASYCYSLYALFAMTWSVLDGDSMRTMQLMDQFYFESAATILTLITLGKMLEAISKGKTVDALKSLMKLAPKTAVLLIDGNEEEVGIDKVKIGDYFVVKAGDHIPVDGVVVEGDGAVDEAALTGESIPVDKAEGDAVSAATTNINGYMVCQATGVGEDTTLSKIIQMVSDAAATKAPIAKIADKVSGIFVPAVISIALITFIVWLFVDHSVSFALGRAISVLVISCPCALGLATPVAIMVGNGVGARHGLMFKTAQVLEETGRVQIVALDKTGTITKGTPKVTDIICSDGVAWEELLGLAYSLEIRSEHPLAKAIVENAKEKNLLARPVLNFTVKAGNGLSGEIDDEIVYGGNLAFMKNTAGVEIEPLAAETEKLATEGKTPLFFAKGKSLLGIIAVADVIKEDSAKAISELKGMGIHVVMLTGDNEKTAMAIAQKAGVDEVVAGVLPDGKESVIRKLQEYGKVAMVGDGINDAPALSRANVGIAIGAGTDVAIDAADVVLMKSNLTDVAAAIRISRATLRNIRQNLFWAFIYNVIGIPLAAGCYIAAFGWTLNPMFGAAAMSLSSFCVVTNALRLNLCKLYDSAKDKPIKNAIGQEPIINNKEEKINMEITVKGMMCAHCEAHVKEALEKLAGVEEAVANHDENLVTLTTSTTVDEADIKAAVEGAGYEYCGIK